MPTTLSERDLTRKQRRQVSKGDHGQVAEELVSEEFGLAHEAREESWYDVRAYGWKDQTTKGEVKSAHTRVGEGPENSYPADGRFRIRRDQHRSLTASDAQATAWYYFVLFNEGTGRIIIQRRRPSTVTRLVNARGGWNESGHEEFDHEFKMPIEAVVDVDA